MAPETSGEPALPVVRLPLQLGLSSNAGVASAAIPLLVGVLAFLFVIVGLMSEPDRLREIVIDAGARFAAGAIIIVVCVPGALLIVYAISRLRGAVRMRPSDIILDERGVMVSGGPHGGTRMSWSELCPPFAEVEATRAERLKPLRILLHGPTRLLASVFLRSPELAVSPRSEVTVWRLWLHRAGGRICVAEADSETEARSMEAAASSIVAVEEGRRHVVSTPQLEVELLTCPRCGAPGALEDVERLLCSSCGASMDVPAALRARAAAAMLVKESRRRAAAVASKLLSQPTGEQLNSRLWTIWITMLVFPPLAFLVWLFHRELGLGAPWGLASPQLVLFSPIAAVGGMFLLGRLLLVSRRALQLLTLGFGALAPTRDGAPPRCRRCHGPLSAPRVGGATSCGYCGSDNLVGIDLRPEVDRARAESQTFDEVLDARRRSLWRWGVAALVSLALMGTAAAATGSYGLGLLRASQAQSRACDGGDMAACAWLFERNQRRGQRRELRAEVYRRPCELGHAEACHQLARRYETGNALRKDRAQAAAYYEMACRRGAHGPACTSLGLLVSEDAGGEEARTAAMRYFELACGAESAAGCYHLGRSHAAGEGGAGSFARAAAYFERACEAGYADGCAGLGELFLAGEGVPQSDGRAATLYQRACDEGSAMGCENLAELYREGRGVERAHSRARHFTIRACDLGLESACRRIGRN
jgi:uncharacterized protein